MCQCGMRCVGRDNLQCSICPCSSQSISVAGGGNTLRASFVRASSLSAGRQYQSLSRGGLHHTNMLAPRTHVEGLPGLAVIPVVKRAESTGRRSSAPMSECRATPICQMYVVHTAPRRRTVTAAAAGKGRKRRGLQAEALPGTLRLWRLWRLPLHSAQRAECGVRSATCHTLSPSAAASETVPHLLRRRLLLRGARQPSASPWSGGRPAASCSARAAAASSSPTPRR
jgi:hypothetical protein